MLATSFGLPEPPWIIGHRGAAASQPENTLASVAAAVEQGADMIEVDVQLTTDGELLLVHDWDIELAGQRRVIEEYDARELRQAAAGAGKRLAEAPLPTLAELFAQVPTDVPLNLELKRRRADRRRWCESLLPLLADRPLVLVSSFDHALLATLRAAAPKLPLAPIGSRRPHELLRAAESLDAASLHCHRRLAFSDLIAAAGLHDWPVLVYTVNEAAFATELFARGVSGVFTDKPGELRTALDLP